MARPLEGKVAVVTGAEEPLARGLAAALAEAGAAVALLGAPTRLARLATDLVAADGRAAAVAAGFGSRADVEAAFAAAADALGGPVDVVLHAWMPAVAFERVAFADVDDERWDAVWEGAMQATLFVLQAGYEAMRGRGGRFVLVTPTVSMSGADHLVPYTTAVEGQRLLAKSAARQWGPDGITVNCLAPAPELVPIGVESLAVSLAPPALGGPGDPAADLGPVAVFLASDAGHFVTGVTVCADGGVWMAP